MPLFDESSSGNPTRDADKISPTTSCVPPSPLRQRKRTVLQLGRTCVFSFLIVLVVFFGQNSPFSWGVPSIAYAASNRTINQPNKPNRYNAKLGAQPKNQGYTPAPMENEKPHAPQSIKHNTRTSMRNGLVELHTGKQTIFKGSDGRLELVVPQDAVSADDIAKAGGKLSLQITQIAPASGSSAGGSGHISFGTYLFQLVDAHGTLINHGLRAPITAKYHYKKNERALNLERSYVVINGTRPKDIKLAPAGKQVDTEKTFGVMETKAAKVDPAAMALTVSPMISTPSTSMSFGSDTPVSSFGKPDPFTVDLNGGSLTAGETIDVPEGPGNLTPPVSLSYSSAGVNEQHNPSSAAGWVGEGWNLSLGSINWSEHNVLAGCQSTNCGTNWENTWQISDPFGTSSELIPPDIDVSTYYDDTTNSYCATGASNAHPCPILWHTANESHAKIYSYVGPVDIGQPQKPPCFRVWLPNGLMEEFGCTLDSLQYYYIAGIGAAISAWNLDLITDPKGNQIHLTYQRDMASWTSSTTGTTYTYPRDVVLSTIEYDSPNCHDAQNMCTGANWAPLMRINFAASHSPARLTGSVPSGCNTGSNLRCDDPLDLSGSGGSASPLIQSTFVLNNIQVQVRNSGTTSWNTLHDYRLGYEQSAPSTIVDPATGKNASTAGMLDLTQIQEVGSLGATALMYSGKDNSTSTSHAYLKVFDLSSKNIVVGPNTNLSYWVYPQSSTANGLVSGNNSTCVAVDLIFTDGSNLRDKGAVDQSGNRVHPASQCGHLTLDKWNQMTSNIGAVANGKTISRIDIGYDQPGNTGGYRGYLDDISLSNSDSTTPLFSSTLENGDPQPNWTDTVDTGPEAGAGNSTNVGGFCCSLPGAQAGLRQEVFQTDSAALPMRTYTYTTQTNYYEDSNFKPNPATNCGPSWNTGNGSGCLLWSKSYDSNGRFLSSSSNGMGLSQTFSWTLARNNTHGVPGGGSNNADTFYCNAHQSGYPCNEADDGNWSRMALTQESSSTQRVTQNGVGGQQSTTTVTNANSYTYQLSYPLVAQECGDCVAGMYWGNQNDDDYLGYYNARFMGFAQATVSLADGAKEVHKYYGTEGYGLWSTSEVACQGTNPCHASPWSDVQNAAHGHEYESFYYGTDGTTLLKHETQQYQAVCPPSGVSGTPYSSTYGDWNGQLVSALDHNNPVAVCDVQDMQNVSETIDGTGNSVKTTSTPTYDSYGRVTQTVATSNGGTPGQITSKTSYIWNDAVTATQTSANGTYIISTPAFSDTEDSSGKRASCSYLSYDGSGYATGQSSSLTSGLVTTQDSYTDCGTAANGYTPSGQIRETTTYDTYGNQIATDDADANANISGHKGCTINSATHTDCLTYDSLYATLETTSTNALNQTTSTSFSNTATGGFGLWPMNVTDFNGQATAYSYDTLGRMTSQALPGETAGKTTQNWTFATWCSGTGPQAPCVEIDQTDRLDASNTITSRAFYDGEGRLVETRHPGPAGQDVVAYASYDASGHMTFESNSYFVPAYTGPAGSAAYSPPDSTQVGTSTSYDGLERPASVTDPNSQITRTAYTVICGVAGYTDSGCYEQTTVVDANSHQRATLTDAFGKVAYDLRYTGTSGANYALYVSTAYGYDLSENLVSIQHPDKTTTTTFSFNAAGQKISQTDPDRGTESYSYDPNGNLIQAVDARGVAGTVYAGYDGLDRLLWRNTTNSPTNARVSYTYDSTANGNYGVGRKTGETFTGSGGLTGAYSFTYDRRGQQTGQTISVKNDTYPITKSYDDAGHVLSETYPTGEVVQVAYSQGWLNQVTTTKGATTTTIAGAITYGGNAGAAAHVTSMLLGNSVYTYSASYDNAQRLTSTSVALTSNHLTLFSTQPTYEGVGNVTSVQTTVPDGTDKQQFCYDEQNRLTWAGSTGTAPCNGPVSAGTLTAAQYQHSYSYDILGRLLSGPAGNDTYGDSNHLHAVTASSEGYSASYDAAGNMVCRAPTGSTTCAGTPTGQLLSYDAEGMLTSWQDQPTPTKTVNYLYDGEGERVALQTSNGGTTSTTAYIDNIEEVQSSGGITNTTTYYYADQLRVAEAVNGAFSYLANDRLGSPVLSLNASGGPQATILYSPYGAPRYSSGSMPTDIGFTGQHSDADTGLDYYVSRYYDPTVGQFSSADTALPESGYNPWGLSRYAYVQGNPETLTDPDGHCWPLCTMAIGAVVGAAIGAGISIATQAASGHGINWHHVAREAAVGAVSGAVSGLAGPGAGLAVHAAVGAASGAAGQVVSNYLNHKPLGEGVLTASVVGGVMGFASEGASRLVSRYGGRFFGSFANKARSFFKSSGCGNSFSADTPVATPTGEQPIGTVQVGDKVQAYNPQTKQTSTQTVQHVFINHDNDLLDVTLVVDTQVKVGQSPDPNTKQKEAEVASHGSLAPPTKTETVHTTQTHPWLTTRGWLPAGELQVGDHVQRLDGITATVVALRVIPGEQNMYDLMVSNVHTFAVGQDQFVVHNCNFAAKQAQARARELFNNGSAAAKAVNPRAWFSKKVTIAVAHTDSGRRLVAMNAGSLNRWSAFVRPQIRSSETWVMGIGRQHAEQILINYAQKNNLRIIGFGVSRQPCRNICRPLVRRMLRPRFMGWL